MVKKVLFFDIDGTLLNSELKIPEGVKKELPYAIRMDTRFEYSQMFGKDKIEQMMRNIPIGCAPM